MKSLEDRQLELEAADSELREAAEAWVEARAGGRPAPAVEARIAAAERAYRNASNKLQKARART